MHGGAFHDCMLFLVHRSKRGTLKHWCIRPCCEMEWVFTATEDLLKHHKTLNNSKQLHKAPERKQFAATMINEYPLHQLKGLFFDLPFIQNHFAKPKLFILHCRFVTFATLGNIRETGRLHTCIFIIVQRRSAGDNSIQTKLKNWII